jgi:cytochrome P450
VGAQLGLAVAAVQTISEATCQALHHLCEYPQYIAPLRAEAIAVPSQHGWARTSLYQLRLMDSFLKESQRFTKGCQGLGRMATKDVILSDGLLIPKNTRVLIEARFWDPEIYGDDVKEFDALRFLKSVISQMRRTYGSICRQARSLWGLVWDNTRAQVGQDWFRLLPIIPNCLLTSVVGRFFASNEIKIALTNLLLKYNWSLPRENSQTKSKEFENINVLNMDAKLMHKRRQAEIDLDKIKLAET